MISLPTPVTTCLSYPPLVGYSPPPPADIFACRSSSSKLLTDAHGDDQQINEKPQVVGEYESGKAIPNPQLISKLERALGVRLPRPGKKGKK